MSKQTTIGFGVLAGLGLCSVLSLPVMAAGAASVNYYWKTAADGYLSDPANWTLDGGVDAMTAPDADSDLHFDLGWNYIVHLDASSEHRRLTAYRESDLQLDLGGYALTLSGQGMNDISLCIGRDNDSLSPSSMTVYDGTLNGAMLLVAETNGSVGTLNVSGIQGTTPVNTTVNLSMGLEVGVDGVGQATFSGSGVLLTADWCKLGMWDNSSGQLVVTDGAQVKLQDKGSYYHGYLLVGERNNGTVEVTNGGQLSVVNLDAAINPGSNSVTSANILVQGTGSLLTVEQRISLGFGAEATLTIDQKASGSCQDMVIGVGWSLQGTGRLNITNGGTFTSHDTALAENPNSVGYARVQGIGSTWTVNETLTVGLGGQAGMDSYSDPGLLIADGGSMTVNHLEVGGVIGQTTTGNSTGWSLESGTGSVRITGLDSNGQRSQMQVNSETIVGHGGNGTLAIDTGGQLQTSWLNVGSFRYASNSDDQGTTESLRMGNGHVAVTGWSTDGTSTLNSRLIVSQETIVGHGSQGWLEIANGGQMETARLLIGVRPTYFDVWGNEWGVVGDGSVDVVGSDALLKITGDALTIGRDLMAQGKMSVQAGGQVIVAEQGVGNSSAWVVLGEQAGSSGELLIYGSGSTFTNERSPLIVGEAGFGSLAIHSAGTLNNLDGELWVGRQAGSQGHIFVGSESQLLQSSPWMSVIGVQGFGQIQIANGGFVRLSGLSLGDEATGQGQAMVDGLDSSSLQASKLQVIGSLTIGNIGRGSLSIINGGQVTASKFLMGGYYSDGVTTTYGNGIIRMSDAGSSLTVTDDDLWFSANGTAMVVVGNGASITASNGDLFVACWANSQGDVTIDGSGSKLIAMKSDGSGGSWVGREGRGTLTVSNHAYVKLTHLTVGEQPTGQGYVTVTNGATLELVHGVQVGPSGQGHVHLEQGTIQLGDESMVIRANGTLSGSGQIIGGVLNESGLVTPGSSPGLLTVNYFGQQSQGTMLMEIAGLTQGTLYDAIQVIKTSDGSMGGGGNVDLSGRLILSFIDGFAPLTGERFDLITAEGSIQFWSALTVEYRGLMDGWQYELVAYHDDLLDLDVLRLNSLSDGVVPEPASLSLLAIAAIGLSFGRRQRRA